MRPEDRTTKTGIEGFDRLIGGGFPAGSMIVLSGTPATGKTIFAMEYLVNGIKKFNENGIYVTFEEKAESLRSQANQFGWDLNKMEKEGKLRIMQIHASEITKNSVREIIETAREKDAKRIVIDSLSTLSINIPTTYANVNEMNDYTIKRFIYSFIDELKQLRDATSLLITQTINDSDLSRDNISEFICDGLIHIAFESMGGEFSRSLMIRKMRQRKNDEDIHPMEISEKGIVVHTLKD